MTYYVDIDNTICSTTGSNYQDSTPIFHRILRINELFNNGHNIFYWTARGNRSNQDHHDLTIRQLDLWGCLRHGLIMNKPSFDLLIDDKAIDSEAFFI